MEPIQLYKKRDFSDYINDTILFFKTYGKEYFRNFIITNGWLVLLFCVIYFFSGKLSSILSNPFDNGFEINGDVSTLPFVLLGLLIITGVAYSIYSITFPILYLQRKGENPEEQITSKELNRELKNHFFPTLKFCFFSLFTIIPLAIIAFILNIALMFIIIGIPLFFIVTPAITIWFTQSLYVYLNEDLDFFGSLGKGWTILIKQFWHKIGASVIVFFCVIIINIIFILVPTFLVLGHSLTASTALLANPNSTLMIVINILSTIVSFFLTNIVFVQQGIIYYSSIEYLENTQAFIEIDNIGKNEE